MKDLAWVGSSQDDLRAFPEDVRRDAGYQLDKIQRGGQPTDFKPMHTVGSGVYEIRVRGEAGQFRVFYVAKFEEAVYVLHAFQKQSQKTPRHEIKVAQDRYQALEEYRRTCRDAPCREAPCRE